ncbi:OmpH family outer membrane protein [Novosphingobium sp.]|uniref:OmpH family outer membrane protein n=1 Tax=Novosphingobium sp. TaxID=1874826 RepID=UPI00286E1661|nr:OmpH family outer membrane protein [Novosphingobium sp.]
MKTILKAATAVAVVLTVAQPAIAQTPAAPAATPASNGITVPGIGIANIDLIVVNSNAFKVAQTQRPQTYKATYDAAEARRKQIADQITGMVTKFNADRALPNANQQALAQQAQSIQAMEASGTQELQKLLQPVSYSEAYVQEQISEKLNAAINTAMTKQRITLLLNPSAVVATTNAYNLNQAILTELNTALPSAQLVPPAGWEPREVREAKAQQAAQQGGAAPAAPVAPAPAATTGKKTKGR